MHNEETISIEALTALVGQEVGVGPLVRITQQMINQFAEVTGDTQFIHVDVERARQTHFGGTIAHGMLSLSLITGHLSHHMQGPCTRLQGRMTVNLGLRAVQFLAPIPAGSNVRCKVQLLEVVAGERAQWVDIVKRYSVYLEGSAQAALVAEIIYRTYL